MADHGPIEPELVSDELSGVELDDVVGGIAGGPGVTGTTLDRAAAGADNVAPGWH